MTVSALKKSRWFFGKSKSALEKDVIKECVEVCSRCATEAFQGEKIDLANESMPEEGFDKKLHAAYHRSLQREMLKSYSEGDNL